ncbi:hypothetical protein AAZV13_19G028350 [Glycine max]|uniref:Uncharacterized protein n=1 Tax=Glycine soja TaxID=3848 RepID=A0A0B2P9T9_GLYSO|nr:hypothetical protein JHK87_052267 [Glycine soja]KAG4926557.1 hypothetical protein JHK85_053043 [Glycine max]KHN04377.1 hypothetical protein glysoja_038019 [Glycine soja]
MDREHRLKLLSVQDGIVTANATTQSPTINKSPTPKLACPVLDSTTLSQSPQAPNSFASSSTLLTTLLFPAPTNPLLFNPTNSSSLMVSMPLSTLMLQTRKPSSENMLSMWIMIRGLSSASLRLNQTDPMLSSMELKQFPCQPICITCQQLTLYSRLWDTTCCSALKALLHWRRCIEFKSEGTKSLHKATPVCSGNGLVIKKIN